MADKVLYFPYTNVPASGWLARVALYWDEIGCILPDGYFDAQVPAEVVNRGRTDPWFGARASTRRAFTRELIDARLVRPVNPDEVVVEPSFIDDFLSCLDQAPELGEELAETAGTPVLVHSGKLTPMLFRELRNRGLAVGRFSRGQWVTVERNTAAFYVFYLAARLGGLPQIEMTPITDEASAIATLASNVELPASVGGVALQQRQFEMRHVLLTSVLPGPVITHDQPPRAELVTEIMHFKERYHDALIVFRREVERRVLALCAYDEPNRSQLAQEEAQRLRDESVELAERMREHAWSHLRWGTVGLVGAVAGVTEAAVTQDPMGLVGAATGLVLAARELVSARMPSGVPASPLAYAVQAQQRFI